MIDMFSRSISDGWNCSASAPALSACEFRSTSIGFGVAGSPSTSTVGVGDDAGEEDLEDVVPRRRRRRDAVDRLDQLRHLGVEHPVDDGAVGGRGVHVRARSR